MKIKHEGSGRKILLIRGCLLLMGQQYFCFVGITYDDECDG
jgi:hypothetical protein